MAGLVVGKIRLRGFDMEPCEIAVENVLAGVNPDRRFPRNIFVGEWSDFFFFDSDWMRVPNFVEHVKLFLDIEGGQCACLWNLDSEGANEPRFLFVRGQTTSDEYLALLAGPRLGFGWQNAVERLACASDVGEWCMYCEPNNDIAVIGFRQADAYVRYSSAMARVHATRFEEAVREPALSYGFSVLPREWRDAFSREYAARVR